MWEGYGCKIWNVSSFSGCLILQLPPSIPVKTTRSHWRRRIQTVSCVNVIAPDTHVKCTQTRLHPWQHKKTNKDLVHLKTFNPTASVNIIKVISWFFFCYFWCLIVWTNLSLLDVWSLLDDSAQFLYCLTHCLLIPDLQHHSEME